MDPLQKQKQANTWYAIIILGVWTLVIAAFGSFAYVVRKKVLAAKPIRDRNYDILNNRVRPKIEAELRRIPNSKYGVIVNLSTTDDMNENVPYSNSGILFTSDKEYQDIERLS